MANNDITTLEQQGEHSKMQNNGPPQNLQPKFKFYEGVRVLAALYPGAFFEDPRLRRPLKHDIVQDIAADIANDANSELRFYNIYLIAAVVDRYCSHAGYQQACSVPGTPRVDLNGKQVGKVTAAEAREADIKARGGFADITVRKRDQKSFAAGAVNTAMNSDELFASAKNHLTKFEALRNGDIEIARLVLEIAISELQTLNARLIK